MDKGIIGFLIIGAVLLFVGFLGVGSYNGLVTLDESVNASWSQVENVYQRRLDLIPNLVSTVKGYADHEKDTLETVIKARAQATQPVMSGDAMGQLLNNPGAFQKFQAAQGGLTAALSKLMLVVERYPDLKANQNFLELQSQLEGTENRISVERKRFNDTVKLYNIKVRTFPSALVAAFFGFKTKPMFKADAGAKVVPKVEF